MNDVEMSMEITRLSNLLEESHRERAKESAEWRNLCMMKDSLIAELSLNRGVRGSKDDAR